VGLVLVATSPAQIRLSEAGRAELSAYLAPTAQNRQCQRALIVLAAARGDPNQKIADDLGISRKTAAKWRGRYAAGGIAALVDLPRSGRPPKFTGLQRAQVKAIACSSPSGDKGLPLARWSTREVARQAVLEGVVEAVSRWTVGRWLAEDIVKPWQTRSWISPRAPDFAERGGVVLDLWQRLWDGRPLGEDEYVISADEKPGIQVLRRGRPPRPLAPGGPRRVEFDYVRGGTVAYLAAMDVSSGEVMGVCDPTTGIAPFARLVDLVMGQEPYKSARRVFWVVDNGSSHRGGAAQLRLQDAWPNALLVHTPVHASWLNQIEVFFSILSRKALNGESFNSVEALAERILAFQDWYNQTAQPFNWTWTRRQLNDYLQRLNQAA
jgi:transposase